jgi:hypothetical protein
VRDLHGHVWRNGQQLLEQDLGVLAAGVRARPDMNDDRQPVRVGRLEDPADFLHMLGVPEVHS